MVNQPKIYAHRYHDFSYGHKVYGHSGKCRFYHGHNGRVIFYCCADNLDNLGMVVDFSVIKDKLCNWLEDNWDHKFLMWEKDPDIDKFYDICPESLVIVPFNPTAENMADHLLNVIAPKQLEGTGCKLTSVTVMETRKCGATVDLDEQEVG